MNDTYIVTVYVVINDLLKAMNYADDSRSQMSAAQGLTIAVVAAKSFQNHHERALQVLGRLGYVPSFSVSRFNRRLHALADLLSHILVLVSEVMSYGSVFIIDAMPLPVCKRVRASRCRKVQGEAFEGYCAAKREYYFGWQLHLLCDSSGVPVAFEMLPAAWDELVPVQALLAVLPPGSLVVADPGYISQQEELLSYLYGEVRLIPRYRNNMRGNSQADKALLDAHRRRIETVNSQLYTMGLQHLHARTNPGFALKVAASLVALAFTNALN